MGSILSEDEYWEKRPADSHDDWGGDKTFLESYRESVSHPHRQLILDYLKDKDFDSLLEVGCCNGPNLYRIRQKYPNIKLEGQDVNGEALKDAQKWITDLFSRYSKLPEVLCYNKYYDYILADAVCMYVQDIDKALSEMKRVATKGIIIFDWDTPTEEKINYSQTRNWYLRLEDAGFKDIQINKLTHDQWPSENWIKYGRFITCQVV